jgi:hypothetical protein
LLRQVSKRRNDIEPGELGHRRGQSVAIVAGCGRVLLGSTGPKARWSLFAMKEERCAKALPQRGPWKALRGRFEGTAPSQPCHNDGDERETTASPTTLPIE